ncbi:hypothetical protein CF392_01015 [Tamilnaduibacter salinus]|uniref:Flagellar hook-length control protein-like C-terminal domain-containing protein n=1 Tax=Tamilnaduibacter salinus TaxID=1484056 RepID=A0A2A2I8I6_9GAMM|nr:flagellar hook-length control protein FliK [Tamilnaduibacter salinus]PAV27373.1 hypothetical protein CF392_01015 [Tamilnaduibacter salinus]
MPNILPTVANATPSKESTGPAPRSEGGSEDSQDRFSDVSRREQAQMNKTGERQSADRDSSGRQEAAGDDGRESKSDQRTDRAGGRLEKAGEAVLTKGESGKPALTAKELEQLLDQAESGDMPFSFVSLGGSLTTSPDKAGSLDLTIQGVSLGSAQGQGLTGGQSQDGTLRLMQVMGFSRDGTGSTGMERLASLFSGVSGGSESAKALDFSAELSSRLPGQMELSGMNRSQSLAGQSRMAEGMVPLKNYATSVELPVQHAEWGEKVAGKLAWLTSQRMSAAEIHVVPPDMGPIDVRVQVQNDQANVTVHATNTAVRDQLELNSHRLRDMLQENGLNLDKFEVSADTSGEQANAGPGDDSPGGGPSADGVSGPDGEAIVEDGVTGGSELDIAWRGQVDLYA